MLQTITLNFNEG